MVMGLFPWATGFAQLGGEFTFSTSRNIRIFRQIIVGIALVGLPCCLVVLQIKEEWGELGAMAVGMIISFIGPALIFKM